MKTEERCWLIRYADHSFSRPLNEAELLKLFSDGSMKPQDELCCSGGYWFSVKDPGEMRKYFGDLSIDHIFRKQKEEITEEHFKSTAKIVVPKKEMEELKKQAEITASSFNSTPRPVESPEFAIRNPFPKTEERPASFSAGKFILFALAILVGILFFLRMS